METRVSQETKQTNQQTQIQNLTHAAKSFEFFRRECLDTLHSHILKPQ